MTIRSLSPTQALVVLQGREKKISFGGSTGFKCLLTLDRAKFPLKKKAFRLKYLLIKRKILPPSGLPGRKQPKVEPEQAILRSDSERGAQGRVRTLAPEPLSALRNG